MKLSQFGEQLALDSGINSLMEDLAEALAQEPQPMMLGGGNPGYVPAVERYFQARLKAIADDLPSLRQMVGVYDAPQGQQAFIAALAGLLQRTYGWPIGPEHIALTSGSQAAFFTLFNLFAGRYADGSHRKILLPLAPEYIGYADVGLHDHFFHAEKPSITLLGEQLFKYHVDFNALQLDDGVGAICVSRPTNPTGNLLTDAEMAQLDQLARDADIPLIVDCAYGLPFPGLVYEPAAMHWNPNTILCFSLSKFGLPTARTGIVVARPEVIQAVTRINAITQLAPGSFGPTLARELVESGDMLSLARDAVRPFYQSKRDRALAQLQTALAGYPARLHVPEGAMFLWLWLDDFPLSSLELYQQLKHQGVIVVSGHYFFPGLRDDWPHRWQCLRLNYSQDDTLVQRGLEVVARVVKEVYDKGNSQL